jgi:hypothetical protein
MVCCDYKLQYPAPGHPVLAQQVKAMLTANGQTPRISHIFQTGIKSVGEKLDSHSYGTVQALGAVWCVTVGSTMGCLCPSCCSIRRQTSPSARYLTTTENGLDDSVWLKMAVCVGVAERWDEGGLSRQARTDPRT